MTVPDKFQQVLGIYSKDTQGGSVRLRSPHFNVSGTKFFQNFYIPPIAAKLHMPMTAYEEDIFTIMHDTGNLRIVETSVSQKAKLVFWWSIRKLYDVR